MGDVDNQVAVMGDVMATCLFRNEPFPRLKLLIWVDGILSIISFHFFMMRLKAVTLETFFRSLTTSVESRVAFLENCKGGRRIEEDCQPLDMNLPKPYKITKLSFFPQKMRRLHLIGEISNFSSFSLFTSDFLVFLLQG